MASLWNNAPYWSVSLLLFAYVYTCLGCSPPEGNYTDPTFEEKMFYSEWFVYGKVRAIYTGGYTYDTLYTVEVEVYCTFKGSALPQRFNISDAGYEPGLCVSNNFSVGGEYFIFLDRDHDKLRPSYNEFLLSDAAPEVDDISIYCEHDINYPINVTEEKAVKMCPEPYPDYPNCIKYEEPTVVATPMPPKDTDSAGLSVGDGKSETGEVVSIDKENSGSRVLLSAVTTVLCVLISIV